jgi:hypothetical protein
MADSVAASQVFCFDAVEVLDAAELEYMSTGRARSLKAAASVLALALSLGACRPTGAWGKESEEKFLDWCINNTHVGDLGGRGECECVLDSLEETFASGEAWAKVEAGIEAEGLGYPSPFDMAGERCLPPM